MGTIGGFRRLTEKNGVYYATVRGCGECPFRHESVTRYRVIENGNFSDDDIESSYQYPCSLDHKIIDTPEHRIHERCPMQQTIICVATKPMDSYDIKELLKRED